MGLIMNIYRDSAIPFTQFGGTTMSSEFTNFNKPEQWFLTYITEASFAKTTSLPDGNNTPTTWRMPLKAGAISSCNRLLGVSSISANGHYGLPLIASLVGSGGITQALGSLGIAIYANITASGGITTALGSLLAQIAASISGNGTISSSEMLAYLNAIANLIGSGEVTNADLEGVGELIAILEGDGLLDATLIGTGELESTIRSYGSLTPEGIRDTIWTAIATQYLDPLTMGGKVNNAGAAANPWDVVFGTMTAGEILEAIFKITNNKVVKSGNIITIFENDEVTVWKTFDLSLGGRIEQ